MGTVGIWKTGFNLLNVLMGLGIIVTPISFKLIGIVGGCVGMTIIGCIMMYTMKL